MRTIIEFTYALQITVIMGGLVAALTVDPLFLFFSVWCLVLLVVLRWAEKAYEQLHNWEI